MIAKALDFIQGVKYCPRCNQKMNRRKVISQEKVIRNMGCCIPFEAELDMKVKRNVYHCQPCNKEYFERG